MHTKYRVVQKVHHQFFVLIMSLTDFQILSRSLGSKLATMWWSKSHHTANDWLHYLVKYQCQFVNTRPNISQNSVDKQ